MTDPVTPMPRDVGWATYTDHARRLAALLQDERSRAEQQAAASRSGQAALDQITHRLAVQRQHLHQLAATLRLPEPHVGGISPPARSLTRPKPCARPPQPPMRPTPPLSTPTGRPRNHHCCPDSRRSPATPSSTPPQRPSAPSPRC